LLFSGKASNEQGGVNVRIFKLLLLTLPLLGSACSNDQDAVQTGSAAADSAQPVIASINNTTGEVTLSLTADYVSMQLSEDTLEEINSDFEEARSENSDSELVNRIKNTVLNRVERMLATQLRYPIENIDRINWDDGEMVFLLSSGNQAWDMIWVGDDAVLETFDEDDALEFIEAFEEVKTSGQ
jgi:hypothetical protein